MTFTQRGWHGLTKGISYRELEDLYDSCQGQADTATPLSVMCALLWFHSHCCDTIADSGNSEEKGCAWLAIPGNSS